MGAPDLDDRVVEFLESPIIAARRTSCTTRWSPLSGSRWNVRDGELTCLHPCPNAAKLFETMKYASRSKLVPDISINDHFTARTIRLVQHFTLHKTLSLKTISTSPLKKKQTQLTTSTTLTPTITTTTDINNIMATTKSSCCLRGRFDLRISTY